MALSTANIKTTESKLSKTILPGNIEGRIYDISLKPGYNPGSYYLVLNIETQPLENFEGFYLDPSNESKGRFAGQVGRVRASQYAFEDKTLPSGVKINRDENIMRTLLNIAKAQKLEDELNEIEVNTIEELVEQAKNVLCNDIFLHFCIAGKEYTNKEGYTAYDCFLPKMNNKKYAFSNDAASVVTFKETDHIIKEKKKESIESFEPDVKSDFDMF
jgi:hypothetical protein